MLILIDASSQGRPVADPFRRQLKPTIQWFWVLYKELDALILREVEEAQQQFLHYITTNQDSIIASCFGDGTSCQPVKHPLVARCAACFGGDFQGLS